MTTQSGNVSLSASIKGRRTFQIGISTVLLLIAALSSWLGVWVLGRETQELESQLPGLRNAARELQVNDENAIAIVYRHKQWDDENIWDVHLPVGLRFRICVATENVDEKGLPEPVQFAELQSGRHKIELIHENVDDGRALICVLIDEQTEIEIEKPLGWDQRLGTSGGSQVTENQEFESERPAVFYRIRFMIDAGNGGITTPRDPGNGILLWIEPFSE